MNCLGKSRSNNICRVKFYGGCHNFYHQQQQQPHFLESCSLCNKSLGPNTDIFMYRGNAPFCSEECREEQIEIDEAKERHRNRSRGLRNIDAPNKSTKTIRNGSLVAA